MGTPLHVLILEDVPADAELILHELRAGGYDPQATVVDTEREYLAHLDDGLELIIADYSLPQFTAKAALRLLQARGLDIPFIVVTGIRSEEAAVETMKLGAVDYLLKDRLARLGPAVSAALEQRRLRQERQKAEQARKEADQLYRGLFENAVVGFCLSSADGKVLALNQALLQSCGYTPAERPRVRTLARLLESPSGWHKLLQELWARGELHQRTVHLKHCDGSSHEALMTAYFIGSGEAQRILWAFEDVTEWVRAERALRESRAELSAVFETAMDAILTLDEDLRIQTINPAAESIFRCRQADVIGEPLLRLLRPSGLPGDSTPSAADLVALLSRGPALLGLRGGEEFPAEASMSRYKIRGTQHYAIIVRDVSDREAAEQAQRESESRYEAIFEGVRDAIFVEGLDGTILDVNTRACEMYGWSRDELLQMNVKDFILAEDPLLSSDVLIDRRTPNPIETVNRRANGEWFPIQLTARLQTREGVERLLVSVRDMSAMREAETALRETESNYRSIFEGIQDAVLVETLDGRIIDANAQACEMYGWRREELLQMRVADLAPADVPILRADGLQEEKTLRPFETVNLRSNGERFPVHLMARLQLFEGVARLLVVIRDITEIKKAEEEILRRAEHLETLNAIIGASSISEDVPSLLTVALNSTLQALSLKMGLVWAGKEWTCAGVLQAVGELVMSEVAAGLGMFTVPLAMDDWEGVADDDRLAPMAKSFLHVGVRATIFAPIVLGDETIGGLVTAADSHRSWSKEESGLVEAVARQLAGGIQRVRLLRRTRDQALQLQSILDSMPEGVLVLDSHGTILAANPLAQQYVVPLAAYDDLGSLIKLGDLELEAVLTAGAGRGTREVRSTETPPRVFEVQSSLAWLDPGSRGWTVVLRDVTEQRRLVAEAEHQRRLAAVGQLAAGIAHDFNNIIGAIILHTEMLKRESGLSEKGVTRLATIIEQSQRATKLIQQVLDFSRKTIMETQQLDLEYFLQETIGLMRRTLPESIRLTFEKDGEDFFLWADPTRLQQVFMNLAVNARDAMPDGGELAFRLSRYRLEPAQAGPYPNMGDGDWLMVRVADTGKGIPPGDIPRIFEPFFSTKGAKGSGLGLAQVFGIIQQHGGYIDVRSQEGAGTEFTLYLPAYELPSATPAAAPEGVPSSGKGETILIVEDNQAMRGAMAELLGAIDYHVIEAEDGRQALTLLEKRSQEIALVISDLVMPEMGGRELVDRIKAEYPHVQTVLMTGYPLGKETDGLQSLPTTSWIQKPVDLGTLARQVRKALDKGIH